MDYNLWPDFLANPRSYDELTAFWKRLFDPIVSAAPRHWKDSWLATGGCDGTPFRDGDPVSSAAALDRSRAVRIRQDAAGEGPEIIVWIDRYGKDDPGYADGRGMPVMVLSCSRLSLKVAEDFAALGKSWIVDEATEEDLLQVAKLRDIVGWT